MPESLFEHYVLGGGWAMLVLVPASIVAVATILRGAFLLWGSSVPRLSAEVRTTVLEQRRHGSLTLADARVIAMDTAMRAYLRLQPLAAVYSIAPFVGALGTVWSLGKVWRGPVSLQSRQLASALEHAFMPIGWGLVVGLLAITGYTILKSRLARVERDFLVPTAVSALNEPLEKGLARKSIAP